MQPTESPAPPAEILATQTIEVSVFLVRGARARVAAALADGDPNRAAGSLRAATDQLLWLLREVA